MIFSSSSMAAEKTLEVDLGNGQGGVLCCIVISRCWSQYEQTGSIA
jgi:hypothetical protein